MTDLNDRLDACMKNLTVSIKALSLSVHALNKATEALKAQRLSRNPLTLAVDNAEKNPVQE